MIALTKDERCPRGCPTAPEFVRRWSTRLAPPMADCDRVADEFRCPSCAARFAVERLPEMQFIEAVAAEAQEDPVLLDFGRAPHWTLDLKRDVTVRIAPSLPPRGQFTVLVRQDPTGDHRVTWPPDVEWSSPPHLEKGPSWSTLFTFERTEQGLSAVSTASYEPT